MKQRITTVQKEIVDVAAEKGQQMKTDNGCNEPTGEFQVVPSNSHSATDVSFHFLI